MKLEGRVNIRASRDAVWSFLTDAESVSRCMPGVESVEVVVPARKFRAIGALGLGTVKVRMSTDVEWLELDAPNRAKMKMLGSGPGSSVNVSSHMALTDGADDSTDMNWSAEVIVVGTIASLASRLMKPVTKKLTAQFFHCVKTKIEK